MLASFPFAQSPPLARQSIDALYATGYWLLSQERLRPAIDVFRTLVVVAPGDERGWLGLGEAHERTADLRTAEALYALARRSVPTSARCILARARALVALDRTDRVSELLEEAAELAAASGDEELARLISAEAKRIA
jgi:cytochrome c-type biogenesis protein CcmH/NrfG